MPQAAKQRVFAGLLAVDRGQSGVHHRATDERKYDHQACDWKAHTGWLIMTLGVRRLVLRRIGHGDRAAVYDLDVPSLPQPRRVRLLLQSGGHVDSQPLEQLPGQLLASLTVAGGI